VAAIGADYEPPAKAPGEPDSLLKFIANQMKHSGPQSLEDFSLTIALCAGRFGRGGRSVPRTRIGKRLYGVKPLSNHGLVEE
jgi:hypothetical protein